MAGPEKRFEPVAESEVTEAFWDATRERRLVLQWCGSCQEPVWYPRAVCPRCLAADLEWRPSAGTGEIYAISWQYGMGRSGGGDDAYAVALVALDDGVRMMSNVVGAGADEAVVGARVQVTWEALSDGRHLPQFELAGAGRPEQDQ